MPIPPRRIRRRRRSGRLAVGMGVKVRWFLYHLRIPMLYVPSQSVEAVANISHIGLRSILDEIDIKDSYE